MLLVSLTFPVNSLGVYAAKFLHVLSIYSDAEGIGLKQPVGVTCPNNGSLIVSDTGNGRLLRFTFEDKRIGSEVDIIKLPQLPFPLRLKTNSADDIFVLDGQHRRIVRLNPEGRFKGFIEPKGLPNPADFVPRSFYIDRNDDIYILDILSERVIVLNPQGVYLRHINFPADYGFLSDVTVDFKGNILVIDSVTATVYSASKGSKSFLPLTDNLKEYMRFPTSITADSRGRLYLVDRYGGRIAILGQDGSFLGRRSGFGWKEGFLNYPSQLCLDKTGDLFIADTNNNRVQVFELGE
jgi:sugar lactone lactonase YvrE